MRLSPTVERSDAAEALRLMQVRFAQHKWCKDQLRCLGKCSIVPSAQEELRLARLLHLCSGLACQLAGMPLATTQVSLATSGACNMGWNLCKQLFQSVYARSAARLAGGAAAGGDRPGDGRDRHGPHPDGRLRVRARRARAPGAGDQGPAPRCAPQPWLRLCDLANADPCLAWTAGQSLQSSGSTICILSGRIGRGRFSMRGFWGCAPD